MVDPFKVFWVLTNSTYIVTKFIRIGGADENDTTPFFDKVLYETEVDENEDIGHIVLNITARTHNQVMPIRYEITRGNLAGAFAVQNTSGVIYVAGKLDYETIKKYELKLEASNDQRKNYTTVIVHIRDTNDNPPVFERQSYKTQIIEEDNVNLPKRIIKVIALDADKDRPANIVYFLSGQGIDPDNPKNSKFQVDRHTGEIFVLSPLDRDQPDGRYLWRFTVFAQDEGGEGLVGYADVQVVLKDINDNAPIFLQKIYFGNITENGTAGMYVMTITAIDYDDSTDEIKANLLYSIEKNVVEEETGFSIFEIEPQTGIIRTAVCCLDRERTSEYSVQVIATDVGGLTGTGTACITVIDINDMPPSFSKAEWFVEVNETNDSFLPDLPVLIVTVQDGDLINHFRYKIVEDSGYGADKFKIAQNSDGSGSILINKPLDYEDVLQNNGFRFQIQVTDTDDWSNKDHTAYSWVTIKLRDINDNSPIFQQSNINILVPEDLELGKTLATFRAVDPDQNGNSKISYTIDKSSDRKRLFAVNQQGTVSIQRSLDREDNQYHQIIILASDDGFPSRTSTATLNIVVQDVNDNAPIFNKEYRPVISENMAPREIVKVFATDKDDYSAGNGPPFQFVMDPNASFTIQNSFSVDYNPKGDGTALIKSLRSLDREQQKEYRIPIIIKDSGKPIMTGTSTLTIIVGDVNDNNMKNGVKKIIVYKYPGQQAETEIGRVYVYDLDDWDLPDKKFHWEGVENPGFKLNEKTGMITVNRNTRRGIYTLRFKVFDKKFKQTVSATVIVTIKELSYRSVLNSETMRIFGISDEDFIAIWNYKTGDIHKSKLEKFREKMADILKLDRHNVEIFSVQLKSKYPTVTDVRFSAHYSRSKYVPPVKINGLLLVHQEEVENFMGCNISMVGLDELNTCNKISITNYNSSALLYLVDANKTALVSPRINVLPSCSIETRDFANKKNCKNNLCKTAETCIETENSSFYKNRQETTLSFKRDGWAWFPTLKLCKENHLNIEFITLKSEGLLLYNGPLISNNSKNIFSSNFISLELKLGFPRLLVNYGLNTIELNIKTKVGLNDGRWHRLDIFWNIEIIRIVVDFCQSADIAESNDDSFLQINVSSCEAQGYIRSFDDYLNVSAPLQIGGVWPRNQHLLDGGLDLIPTGQGFSGCIRNVFYNSEFVDLAHPALSENLRDSCFEMEATCKEVDDTVGCMHGYCQGNVYEAECHCHPGWSGLNCSIPTIPATFKPESYVKYALSFELDSFMTKLQLRFRTRKKHSELFSLSDQHNRRYVVLEIRDSYLCFRYDLSPIGTEEKKLVLSAVSVNDGRWHIASVHRYGGISILKLDSGDYEKYNESFVLSEHRLLSVDKQEGIYAGARPGLAGISTLKTNVKLLTDCLDDIRLNGKHLPLPPAINGTQWGQVTTARELQRNCLSKNPCDDVICPNPLICVDLWNDYECRCSVGQILSPDTHQCIDKNECLDSPCLNGGNCINLGADLLYKCKCRNGFWGNNCELDPEEQLLKFSIGALSAIFVCLLAIFGLVLIIIFCRRTKIIKKKPPTPNNRRDSVIHYNSEDHEEDIGFDLTTLEISNNQLEGETDKNIFEMSVLQATQQKTMKTVTFLEDHNDRTDIYFDVVPGSLRNYSYKETESLQKPLNSLFTDTKD